MSGAPLVVEVDEVVDLGSEIDCECMLCTLPLSMQHDPIRWRMVLHFPGPYPEPGEATMLLCHPCKEHWCDRPEDFGAEVAQVHLV